MILRIFALIVIFFCTTVAWMILGSTLDFRSRASAGSLDSRVQSTWGGPLEQVAPSAAAKGRAIVFDSSHIDADIHLEHRQKGLLWYSTYATGFRAAYKLTNRGTEPLDVCFRFPFPAKNAAYDDVQITVDGKPIEAENNGQQLLAVIPAAAGASPVVRVTYRTQGLNTWKYKFGENVSQVKDFRLTLRTDFRDVDFPDNTLSPTSKKPMDKGLQLTWTYSNLVSGFPIAVAMPQKLQPGPLAGEISFFAPVSLFFFFFVMFQITTLRKIDLHPVNYFFLACAFFAFHLLLAYLVDHVSIHVAFIASSIVSLGLVISYLRLVTGPSFAFREAAISQFLYLVLFSYAFFFKGYTGLAVTIGAIATLFISMQVTARVNWSEHFGPARTGA